MAIEDFSSNNEDTDSADVEHSDLDTTDVDKVRPYINKTVHENVRVFSSNAGLTMQDAYGTLLQKSLNNTRILEEILVINKEYDEDLDDKHFELLNDLTEKCNSLGRFPTREEINDDEELKGFPIYITFLGKRDRIKSLIKENLDRILDSDIDL